MSIEITMPKLSDTMEEGKILRWLKHPGDQVHRGDALAEVETDKADMVLEAFDDGVLDQIQLKEGESAPVGAVIASLKTAGGPAAKESRAAAGAPDGAKAGEPAKAPAPALRQVEKRIEKKGEQKKAAPSTEPNKPVAKPTA